MEAKIVFNKLWILEKIMNLGSFIGGLKCQIQTIWGQINTKFYGMKAIYFYIISISFYGDGHNYTPHMNCDYEKPSK